MHSFLFFNTLCKVVSTVPDSAGIEVQLITLQVLCFVDKLHKKWVEFS